MCMKMEIMSQIFKVGYWWTAEPASLKQEMGSIYKYLLPGYEVDPQDISLFQEPQMNKFWALTSFTKCAQG